MNYHSGSSGIWQGINKNEYKAFSLHFEAWIKGKLARKNNNINQGSAIKTVIKIKDNMFHKNSLTFQIQLKLASLVWK